MPKKYIEKLTITALYDNGSRQITEIPWPTIKTFEVNVKGINRGFTVIEAYITSACEVTHTKEEPGED